MNKDMVKVDSEECVLIPITLLMDLYAMCAYDQGSDLSDRIKAIFKGKK